MRKLFNKLMARFDQGCATVSRTSSDVLDRHLSLRERLDFYMHLFICDFCRRYHRQMIAIQKLASGVSHAENTDQATMPKLDQEARERIRRAIDPSQEH